MLALSPSARPCWRLRRTWPSRDWKHSPGTVAAPVPGTRTLKAGGTAPQLPGSGLAWAGPAGSRNKAWAKQELPEHRETSGPARPGCRSPSHGESGCFTSGLRYRGLPRGFPKSKGPGPPQDSPARGARQPRAAPPRPMPNPPPATAGPRRVTSNTASTPLPGRPLRMRDGPPGRQPCGAKLRPPAAAGRGPGTAWSWGRSGAGGQRGPHEAEGTGGGSGLYGARGWRSTALGWQRGPGGGGQRGEWAPAAEVGLGSSERMTGAGRCRGRRGWQPPSCPLAFAALQAEGGGRAQLSRSQAWHDCAELRSTPPRPPLTPRSSPGSPQPHTHLFWQPDSCQGLNTTERVPQGKHPKAPCRKGSSNARAVAQRTLYWPLASLLCCDPRQVDVALHGWERLDLAPGPAALAMP